MNKFEAAIQTIDEKATKYAVAHMDTDKIRHKMQTFRINLVLIGAFSAGKSALLNAFLNQDLLTENQRPETAIASELIYDETEYIEAFQGDTAQRFEISEAGVIETGGFDYLRWHLNSDALAELKGYTIVDMPGFNSGIQAHNKALLRYADRANAYLLVIDVEDGGIKQSVKEFIGEVRNYQDNLAIVITKSDLKTAENGTSVKESVELLAQNMFGQNVPVILTSKYDPAVSAVLRTLFLNFDRDAIFRQEFLPPIAEMSEQLIGVLEVLKKNAHLNTTALEREIALREQARTKLTKKLQAERSKLSERFQNSVQPAILADAQNALHQQADALASSLESGGSNFSMLVNNILRPVLVSATKAYVESSFDDFIADFRFDYMAIAPNNADEVCNDILTRYREVQRNLKSLPETISNMGSAYKAVTTALAVTTSFVAPWLELVLIFLPEVIRLFSAFVPDHQHEKAREKVCNEVIPRIIQKLSPEISSSLQEMESELMAQLEENIKSLIDQETSALNSAKDNLAQRREKFERNIQDLDADIAQLRAVVREL